MNAIIATILVVWFSWALLFCLALCAAAADPIPHKALAQPRQRDQLAFVNDASAPAEIGRTRGSVSSCAGRARPWVKE